MLSFIRAACTCVATSAPCSGDGQAALSLALEPLAASLRGPTTTWASLAAAAPSC